MAILNIIVVGIICLLCVVLGGYQVYANYKHPALVSFSTRMLPLCLFAVLIKVIVWGVFGLGINTLPALLLLDIFPLVILASSFLPKEKLIIIFAIGLGALYEAVCIYLKYTCPSLLESSIGFAISVFCALAYAAYYFVELLIYIRRIRNIVKKTTIWTMLSLSVDFVYVTSILGNVVLLYMSQNLFDKFLPLCSLVSVLVLLMTIVSLGYRISTDSLFFFMRRHETIILETINDAPTDISSGPASVEDTYREIYSRVVDYFESDAPYLSGNLVIEDLVKVVYANKLYISRAISRCAGRNFCQFVNYYRIRHSVEVFRRNPELKVAELACQSGFNSVPSFTMAFKLYMDENPSDWIRRERNRLSKTRMERLI